MENSRRRFLKTAGYSILGVGAGSMLIGLSAHPTKAAGSGPSAASLFKQRPENREAERWGMIIDTRKLNESICEKMQQACHSIHNVPDIVGKFGNKKHEIKWIWPTEFRHAFPEREAEFLTEKLSHKSIIPVLCNHCDNPPCVQACPTKATFKRESDGIVMMDFHRCIGCRFCMAACPFGSRSFNFRDPRPAIKKENPDFPTRMRGVVEKCNFCAERLAVGKNPACVEASEGAMTFGDLNDPESEVRKLLAEEFAIRRKPNLGTFPSVLYIV
ncbi:MAG: 4Fe-4S dicluster domain-containing protein [Desulfobacteraceae bacterium]|nr:4Fe-4S dicluster domain-containing protein [Desulfobacteraceae bacterium]MCF8095152.1 4Fe-4S dicluster domain-containing protein [Desulfobacteraceae bacterium]